MITVNHRIGVFDWVDLSTPDCDVARSFYSKLFGWTYQTTDSPMGTYHLAMAGGHEAAGMMAPAEAAHPPVWTSYVRVALVEETVAVVRNAGGTVVAEPFSIPGGAQIAVVVDPAGATFALMSGGPMPEPSDPGLRRDVPGAVAWCELSSRDPHAAISFYDAAFGWQAAADPATGYIMLRLGETDIGGLLPMPDDVPAAVSSDRKSVV